jgi:hypothetical protein
MMIDCHGCQSRGLACGSCAAQAVVSSAPAVSSADAAVVSDACEQCQPLDLGPAELRALRVLANAGMIAPLRYAPRAARAS